MGGMSDMNGWHDIAIIEKRIKLKFYFQETCETFFFLLIIVFLGGEGGRGGGELILPTPWRLGFKFKAKPEKLKKSESWGVFLNLECDQEIFWKTCHKKNCCFKSVTLDLSFISSYHLKVITYIWEKAIILL